MDDKFLTVHKQLVSQVWWKSGKKVHKNITCTRQTQNTPELRLCSEIAMILNTAVGCDTALVK